ncbi:hypothetical protein ACFL0W_01970 [Nanoarchaeota archaeon]
MIVRTEGERLERLRKQIQSIEWDIECDSFPPGKIPYYKELIETYNSLAEVSSMPKLQPKQSKIKK